MRVMLEFPFEKVDGVELSDAIASVARKNFARLKVPETRCTIYATDATQFSQIDDYNFVYLYNPFPCAVMALFMQSLARSIERAPRSLTFIYNNAVCHNEVIAGNLFHKQSEYPDEWGNKIAVYTNRKP